MSKNQLNISDSTAISMPMRNLISIVAAVAVGVWAYFGVLERITMLETKSTLAEKDLNQAVETIVSDLDKNTQAQLTRGERMVEVLKQNQYVPMSVESQVAIIFAAGKGLLDDVEAINVRDFESALLEELKNSHGNILSAISDSGEVSDDVAKKLEKAIVNFKKVHKAK